MSADALHKLPHAYRPFYGAFEAPRPLQLRAIEPILARRDVIVRSPTGQGKTEAVVAPSAELLVAHRRAHALLYITPTRALALDLRRRLRAPLERMGLKLVMRTSDGRWHGQGAAAHVLITTPESLDVALGSPTPELQGFLCRVRAVILDEAHALIGAPRGAQLGALLRRLEQRVDQPLQRIALSATLSDPAAVIAQLGLQADALVLDGGDERAIQSKIVQLHDELELVSFVEDLHHRMQHKKLLVFARSRATCDELYDILSKSGLFHENIYLHYSNIESKKRREIEDRFRESRIGLCVATSTLELGVDIGDIDAVILYGPPDDIASYVQRIGRAGRRSDRSVVWCVCYGERAADQALRFAALASARARGVLEQTPARVLPGVWAQQALSLVYERGEVSTQALERLWPGEREALGEVLGELARRGWLAAREGGRWEGGAGYKRALMDRDLWSNFPASEDAYMLEVDGELIATLPANIVRQVRVGDSVYVAGKRVKVLDILRDPGQVIATRTEEPETARLIWAGAGFATSWEVAQACRALLEGDAAQLDDEVLGLMRRARALIEGLRDDFACGGRLECGVWVSRDEQGRYIYWTFLGAAGNLILRAEAARWLAERAIHDGVVTCDGLCVVSSHALALDALALPTDADSYAAWVRENLRALATGRALNARCDLLSGSLLARELYALTYDPKILFVFNIFNTSRSIIIEGDEDILSLDYISKKSLNKADDLIIKYNDDEYLKEQRALWPSIEVDAARQRVQPLTAQRVGEYILRGRCPRLAAWWRCEAPEASGAQAATLLEARQAGQRHAERVRAVLGGTGRLGSCEASGGVVEALRGLIARPAVEAAGRGWLWGVWLERGEEAAGDVLIEVTRGERGWEARVGGAHAVAEVGAHHRWRLALAHRLLKWVCGDEEGLEVVAEGVIAGLEGAWLRTSLAGMEGPLERVVEQLRSGPAQASQAPAARVGARCRGCAFEPACMGRAWHEAPLELSSWVSDAVWRAGAARTPEALGEALGQGRLDEALGPDARREIAARLEAMTRGEGLVVGVSAGGLVAGARQAIWVEVEEAPGEAAPRRMAWWLVSARGEVTGGQEVSPGQDWRVEWARWSQGARAAYERVAAHGAPQLMSERAATRERVLRWDARSGRGAWRWLGELPRAPWGGAMEVVEELVALPLWGSWTMARIAAALGLDVASAGAAQVGALWGWLVRHAQGRALYGAQVEERGALLQRWLGFVRGERLLEAEAAAALQACSLEERVARGLALGPLRVAPEQEGGGPEWILALEGGDARTSRLRAGDLLRLSPQGAATQRGQTVELLWVEARRCGIRMRAQRALSRALSYSLERASFDDTRGVEEALREALSPGQLHPAGELLVGASLGLEQAPAQAAWAERWLEAHDAALGLEASQREAWRMAQRLRVALVQGPPGTGKTHLLGAIVAGWIARARAHGQPLRVLITALTHRAIDQALEAIARRLNLEDLVYKMGRDYEGEINLIKSVERPEALMDVLTSSQIVVIGATRHGVRRAPGAMFDAMICDEASQMRAPDAVSLLCKVKSLFIFVGDTKQLGPILQRERDGTAEQFDPSASILEHMERQLPDAHKVMLTRSFRMSEALCAGPSRCWYGGALASSAPPRRLALDPAQEADEVDEALDPDAALVVVAVAHRGRTTASREEAACVVALVKRLLARGLRVEQLGLLAPHRQQCALIRAQLDEALGEAASGVWVDTVERAQGGERDVILYSLTASTLEGAEERFVLDERRTNVALTRARSKLIVVVSRAVLAEHIPIDQDAQRRYVMFNLCLKDAKYINFI